MNLDLALLMPVALSAGMFVTMHGAFLRTLRAHRRSPSTAPRRTPRVSVLKPIAGLDDALADNLESFAGQRYPDWELLLGFASASDPAIPVARAFLARHRELDARLVWTDPDAAPNPKVAQLLGLAEQAAGEIFVVSDANVHVGPSYLSGLVAALEEEGVGLVSSLIAGRAGPTFGDALEATQLSGFVAPAVLTTALAGRAITIGKSLAMRKKDLDDLGGFGVVASVLAEDDVLGQLFRAAGHRVELSLEPIENPNVGSSIRRTLERHGRWAKMRRAVEPRAYAAEPLLSPIAMAVFAFAAHPSKRMLAAWMLACLLQAALAVLSIRALHRRFPRWTTPVVEIARAHLVLGCWLWGWLDTHVSWRGKAFRILPGSYLVPLRERPAPLPTPAL